MPPTVHYQDPWVHSGCPGRWFPTWRCLLVKPHGTLIQAAERLCQKHQRETPEWRCNIDKLIHWFNRSIEVHNLLPVHDKPLPGSASAGWLSACPGRLPSHRWSKGCSPAHWGPSRGQTDSGRSRRGRIRHWWSLGWCFPLCSLWEELPQREGTHIWHQLHKSHTSWTIRCQR